MTHKETLGERLDYWRYYWTEMFYEWRAKFGLFSLFVALVLIIWNIYEHD